MGIEENKNPQDAASDNYEIVSFGILQNNGGMYVTIRFTIPSMNRTTDITIPMADVKTKKFESYIPEVFVLSKVRFKNQAELLRMAINEKLNEQQDIKTLLPQGFSKIGDRWFYTVGDYIIGNETGNQNLTAYNPDGIHLWDFYVKEPEQWGDWCKYFVKSGSAQAAMFLASITPFLRPVTEALGAAVECTVNTYILGPTGCGKTTWSKLLATGWDGRTAGVNLGSDVIPLYKEIARYSDMSVLVDDLASTDSADEKAKRLRKLLELLQLNSSSGAAEVKHQILDMDRLNLIVTGEYTPSAAAKLNRCLLVKMEGEFQAEELTRLQQNPKLYRSFAVSFINWIVNYFDSLTDLVRIQHEHGEFMYRGAHAKSSEYYGFARIMTSCRNLMIARLLFLEFLKDAELISDAKELRKLAKLLEEAVNEAVYNTLESVRREPESELSGVLTALSDIFSSDPNNIVTDNIEKYAKKDKKIFLLYRNRIYFKLELFIRHLEDYYQCSTSLISLPRELKKAKLFYTDAVEKSGKIPREIIKGYEEVDKCKGRHFALSRSAVCDLVLLEYPDALQRIYSPLSALRPKKY